MGRTPAHRRPPEERLTVPTFVSGLPLHPLVVHAVVVLVPMALLGALLVAVWPAGRPRWAWPVVVLTTAAVVAIPFATSTGEGLEHNLPRTPAIATHAELGDQLLVFAVPLLLSVFALAFLDRRRRRSVERAQASGPGTMTAPPTTSVPARLVAVVLAALTVAFALVCAVQVFRIGDSGARAAWGDIHYVQQPRIGAGRGGEQSMGTQPLR
jgi:uncharacterized membrane protein